MLARRPPNWGPFPPASGLDRIIRRRVRAGTERAALGHDAPATELAGVRPCPGSPRPTAPAAASPPPPAHRRRERLSGASGKPARRARPPPRSASAGHALRRPHPANRGFGRRNGQDFCNVVSAALTKALVLHKGSAFPRRVHSFPPPLSFMAPSRVATLRTLPACGGGPGRG